MKNSLELNLPVFAAWETSSALLWSAAVRLWREKSFEKFIFRVEGMVYKFVSCNQNFDISEAL